MYIYKTTSINIIIMIDLALVRSGEEQIMVKFAGSGLTNVLMPQLILKLVFNYAFGLVNAIIPIKSGSFPVVVEISSWLIPTYV